MSVSDLIKRGLFVEEPQKNNIKFAKIDDLPEEIKYKLEQYNKYKDLGLNKAAYLYQMLIRIAFIREWHRYKYKKVNPSLFHLLVPKDLSTVFKAIVILIWSEILFSENELPLILNKIYLNALRKKDIDGYKEYIKFLYRSLVSTAILQPYEKNKEGIKQLKEKFFQPATKIKTVENVKQLPSQNILISINPFCDTKILTKSIAKIIHHEKQRLEKNAKNRNTDTLSDKEYDTFLKYNILFYMDIYLYTEIFDITFSNEMWAKIVLGKKSLETNNRKLIVDNYRKYRENFEKIMLKGISNEDKNTEFQIYVQKIQQKLYTEMVNECISDK